MNLVTDERTIQVEVCIGEAPSSEEYLTEEEEIGDDYATSFFNEINYNADSDDMDALEWIIEVSTI